MTVKSSCSHSTDNISLFISETKLVYLSDIYVLVDVLHGMA